MQKIKNVLIISLCFFALVSCTKENTLDVLPSMEELNSTTTSSYKTIGPECPEFEDIQLSDFIKTTYFAGLGMGIIDDVVNCPLPMYEYCGELVCDDETKYFTLLSDIESLMPWNTNGVFTAAEQTFLVNSAIDISLSEAPKCPFPDDEVVMEPISYNFYLDFDALEPDPQLIHIIKVKVVYRAPCAIGPAFGDN